MTHLDVRRKIGLRLRAYREARGMSQDELAGGAKVARTHVSAIELGNDNLGVAELERLTNALGITLGEFFSDPVFFEAPDGAAGGTCPAPTNKKPRAAGRKSQAGDKESRAGGEESRVAGKESPAAGRGSHTAAGKESHAAGATTDADVLPVRTLLHSSTYDERVFAAVKAEPTATVARLREMTGYGEWRVYSALGRLRDAGRVRREGPRNAGRWVVIDDAD